MNIFLTPFRTIRLPGKPGVILPVVALATALGVSCSRKAETASTVAPPPLEYVGEWGVKGDGPGQLDAPRRMALDAAGNCYVADGGSGFVHKFSGKGGPLLAFQPEGWSRSPTGLAVDRGGAIYVADPARGGAAVFLPNGDKYRQLRVFPSRRSWEPLSVTTDSDGNIYIVDGRAAVIKKVTLRGRQLKSWGKKGSGAGELGAPVDLEAGPDGDIYVSDAGNRRVSRYTRDGGYVSSYVVPPDAGEAQLEGIAVSDQYVFAADPVRHAVRVWSLDGKYHLTDDLGGRAQGEGATPVDVAVFSGKELYVLDPVRGRVLQFRLHLGP